MELQLKNIGMIKEANIKVDGLTVIAGENDTGKSTVGKVLFSLIKADMISLLKIKRKQAENILKNRKKNFDTQISLNFKNQISINGTIDFVTDNYRQNIKINENRTMDFLINAIKDNKDISMPEHDDTQLLRVFTDAIFIQTPFVWDLMDTFRGISNLKSESELLGLSTNIPFPYLLWDLYVKLTNTQENESSLSDLYDIEKIINGKFEKNSRGDFKFIRNNKEIEIVNVAAGIRSFGLLQVLLSNHQIHEKRILIFDEPEVHLHPKWQLEMAKIIVELVKNGVKVLVNSHSPYMIEALKRYSEVEKIEDKTNFYLAENGYIEHQESLEGIFEKLALPMRELKKLKMDRYLNE